MESPQIEPPIMIAETLEAPIVMKELDLYQETRPEEQRSFEEEIRDLYANDLTTKDITEALAKICDLGEKYWQSKIDKAQSAYAEENGRLMEDIREDYVRAGEMFQNKGYFPRQVARVVDQIAEIGRRLSEEDFDSVVRNRTQIDYRTGRQEKVSFYSANDKRGFDDRQKSIRSERLARIDGLKTMIGERYPETKKF